MYKATINYYKGVIIFSKIKILEHEITKCQTPFLKAMLHIKTT